MKDKKIISLILSLVMICTLLTACGNNKLQDKLYNESDPIQVTDSAGRNVSFKEPAKTVATSWGGGIDDYLFALGLTDKIAATNSHGDMEEMFFDINTMPKVGRWEVDKEALAEMSPDLFLHGCYETQHLQDANSVGVRSYGMAFNTFADIEKNLTDLGIIFGIEDRAQYVIDYCNNIKKIVETHVGTVAEADRPTVVVLGQQPGELASDIYDNMEEMIEIAGGISCTPDDLKLKTETTVVGLETIFKWNPDVVFLQDMFCEYTVDDLLNDSTWQSTKAVQNGNVFAIPCRVDTWCHSNPSCYLGILYMSMQMYPNLYEDIDIEKMVVDFYREIYGLDLTIEKIGLK